MWSCAVNSVLNIGFFIYHYDIDWYRQTLHILIEKKQVFHQFSSFTIFICIPLSFCNIYSTESHSKDRRWLIFISFSALWHFFSSYFDRSIYFHLGQSVKINRELICSFLRGTSLWVKKIELLLKSNWEYRFVFHIGFFFISHSRFQIAISCKLQKKERKYKKRKFYVPVGAAF